MKVQVTKHAIERYRERMFDYVSPVEHICQLLGKIVRNGKRVYLQPNCFEVKHYGISIVSRKKKNEMIVLTVLGDRKYRKWFKRNESRLHHKLSKTAR